MRRKTEGRRGGGAERRIPPVLCLLAVMLLAAKSLIANEIVVTPEEARLGDAIEIVVRLEGDHARASSLRLPIQNLVIYQGPFRSTEFRWVNGVSSRATTFRYVARPRREGEAVVGPITINAGAAEPLNLPAVKIRILPEAPVTNDPEAAMEQARVRGGLFVTVEANQTEAFRGEQVNLTWTLYSRKPLRGFRLTSVPVLENFWTEEIPQTRRDVERVVVNGEVLQKAIVRRVAVYPLETGPVNVAPVEVLAEVIEDDGFFRGWGFFENRFEEYRVRSGSLDINVKAHPAGAAAVGDMSLQCEPAVVPPTGPVRVDVILSGTGNLRAVNPPRLEKTVNALVEVQSREIRVDRETQPIRMTREWRVLMFPRTSGSLSIPPIRFDYFEPATRQTVVARCGEQKIAVTPQNVAAPVIARVGPDAPERPARSRTAHVPIALGVAALAITGVAWAGAMRRRGDSELVERLSDPEVEPRELRRRLQEAVAGAGFRPAELFSDQSDLGEAFRALHSLIDLMEKEPWEVPNTSGELRKRARDFARQLARR